MKYMATHMSLPALSSKSSAPPLIKHWRKPKRNTKLKPDAPAFSRKPLSTIAPRCSAFSRAKPASAAEHAAFLV